MVKLATKLQPGRAQLQLKVTLQGIKPAIWRRMLVSANIELPTFHAVLQHAFDWTNSHLHAFRIGDQSYETYDPNLWDDWPGGPEKLDEGEFRLFDLLHAKGDRLTYLYDFGDGWRHDVLIEKVLPAIRPAPTICIAGARAAPPEDCGGIPGYYHLVQAMANPRHPEHRRLLEWLGDPYDPEAIDLAEINSRLKSVKI
ncbi:MAG TPA: plasmid pRiA4b ORF-3 family protein [Opitutaceae bacterium]|nr:plasmid pRiA4b ORF-3 family protein [Opitutaceae bacterium]